MIRNKKMIKLPNGTEVEATVVGASNSHEYWNEYMLEDGTSLKLKVVVTEVCRIDGQYDQDDNPVYLVRSSNVVAANSPDSLRRKKL